MSIGLSNLMTLLYQHITLTRMTTAATVIRERHSKQISAILSLLSVHNHIKMFHISVS